VFIAEVYRVIIDLSLYLPVYGCFVYVSVLHCLTTLTLCVYVCVCLSTCEGTIGVAGGTPVALLVLNLVFLYILTLNGLARSMSDLAGITKPSGAIPRGGFLFIVCGLTTILSGYLSGITLSLYVYITYLCIGIRLFKILSRYI